MTHAERLTIFTRARAARVIFKFACAVKNNLPRQQKTPDHASGVFHFYFQHLTIELDTDKYRCSLIFLDLCSSVTISVQ
jgi:hypothetical protein